ncbi:hypothetical protein CRENBAI_019202 [Crenichthys baileyi]|uniref:Uncharacterized protein n=1 Tax=Crenichthys baileyi TaxID=28760 RepID=A0AAV9SAI4_9TELE
MSASGFVLLVLAASLCSGDSRFIVDSLSFIGQKPLTQGMCPECSQIIQLSTNMVFSTDAKVTVFKALHALCQRLPKEQASECESQVKIYLPKIMQQTSSNWKPEEICEVFGLCETLQDKELQQPSHHVPSKDTSSSALGTTSETEDVFSPVCTLCLLFIKKLETLLPKNMTEEALMKVMEEPAPEVDPMSDCESCQTLAALSRLHLGLNATEPQTSAFLRSVCNLHPKAIPKCEAFTRVHGSQLQKVLGNQMDVLHVCKKADLCISSKKLEPLGNNPCTWGPSYWCKNLSTAQECGNQVFCEKYIWKKN